MRSQIQLFGRVVDGLMCSKAGCLVVVARWMGRLWDSLRVQSQSPKAHVQVRAKGDDRVHTLCKRTLAPSFLEHPISPLWNTLTTFSLLIEVVFLAAIMIHWAPN